MSDATSHATTDASRTRRPLRLLHTSDVHLGGGFRKPEEGRHHDHCLCPLDAIEESVARHLPDVVIVAGDLFEHQRVEADLVHRVLGRLAALGAPCILTTGNHDAHDHRTLYPTDVVGRHDLVFLDHPGGRTVELLDGDLVVWGKAMDDHHRGFRPLHDVPERPRHDAWWVVIGHGHHEPEGTDDVLGRSSPVTPGDIEATGADYVALGHWHRRTDVSTGPVTAWYSGAPYGPGASERFNVVDLHPSRGVIVDEVEVTLAPDGCHPG
jgi:DNA repair protein SbcD/Mre11